MKNATATHSKNGDLFEFLALMMLGACLWYIGQKFSVFDTVLRWAIRCNAMPFVMLSSCMGLGAVAGTVRKSIQLRKAVVARAEAEAFAEASARHDPLTGLANRRLFNEAIGSQLAGRQPEEPQACLLVDLDRFKPVNDIHGHAAGNAVLCAIAERLMDTAPHGSTVARLGGDEFVVVPPIGLHETQVVALAQQLIAAVRRPVHWQRTTLEVDATIGVAFASEETSDPESLLHAADVAMYQGKRDGRGTFRLFHGEMDRALKERARLEAELRAAIANGEIRPHYQPVVMLPGRQLVGFEVLARWEHPNEGLLGPDKFITIAEETGMIADLFYSLLRQACLDARQWPSHLLLAVNVSPKQLPDPRLPAKILSVLTQTRFPPGRLEIEITETGLINDLEAARVTLTTLQSLGVRIALDDFGTGYSSLYHLRELKFNKLKIDRSYVSELEKGGDRAKLVDAIIQLGSSLSLQTTAEGVESEDSLAWLAAQGCTYGQGFLFGRPMPNADAEALIRKGGAVASSDPFADGKVTRLRRSS